MDAAIKKAFTNLPVSGGEQCPDDNILAAYLEDRLTDTARSRFESHAAGCSGCAETLALALQLAATDDVSEASRGVVPVRKRLFFTLSLPVSAVAMVVLGIAAGVIFWRTQQESRRADSVPQTSYYQVQKKEPAQPMGLDSVVQSQPETKKPESAPAQVAKDFAPISRARHTEKIQFPLNAPVASTAGTRESKESVAPKPALTDALQLAQKPADLQPAMKAESEMAAEAPSMIRPAAAEKDEKAMGGSRSVRGTDMVSGGAAGRMSAARALSYSIDNSPSLVLKRFREQQAEGGVKATGAKIAGKTFVKYQGYWIDTACSEHADTEVVEIRRDSQEAALLSEQLAEMKELVSSESPVFVYWQEKIWLLR